MSFIKFHIDSSNIANVNLFGCLCSLEYIKICSQNTSIQLTLEVEWGGRIYILVVLLVWLQFFSILGCLWNLMPSILFTSSFSFKKYLLYNVVDARPCYAYVLLTLLCMPPPSATVYVACKSHGVCCPLLHKERRIPVPLERTVWIKCLFV